MLHLINHSLHESAALADCLKRVGSGDVVLLIENAVVEVTNFMIQDLLPEGAKLFALKEDLLVRGLDPEAHAASAGIVDYSGFVDLVEAHNPIQSWF